MGTPPSLLPARCPDCGIRVSPGDSFCEACGRRLTERHCTGCGAAGMGEDGYCERCGLRGPAASDHVEIEAADGPEAAAGVSDRGLRHRGNEDAMALAVLPGGVLGIVCDGVSSSPRPQEAARIAARTGAAVLAKRIERGGSAQARQATLEALQAAAEAVAATAGRDGAPACTYVSVLVSARQVTVGWIGDSRAYWLAAPRHNAGSGTDDRVGSATDCGTDPGTADAGPEGAGLRAGTDRTPADHSTVLTEDDSWAARMAATGAMTEEQAQASRHAHTLTGWLGADARAIEGHVAEFAPEGPGTVLVCSDGLWNYLPAAAQLAAAVTAALDRAPPGTASVPLTVARSLVRTALDAGGRDNVTVVVIPFPPVSPGPNGDLTAEPPHD